MEDQTNKLMPTDFRTLLHIPPARSASDYSFLRMAPLLERAALLNNYQASQWAINRVEGFHEIYLSGGIGFRVIKAITDKVMGEGVRIGKLKKGDEEANAKGLNYEMKPIEQINQTLYEMFYDTLSRGAALLRLCFDKSKRPYWDIFRLGRFAVSINEYQEITESSCYLEEYTRDNDSSQNEAYCIVERRYFKNGLPKARYSVYKTTWLSSSDVMDKNAKSRELEYADIPEDIIERYEGVYDFRKEIDVPIRSGRLGVYLVSNSEVNSRFPSMYFGESQLMPALDELYAHDFGHTCKENDKYIGRGRILIPEIMQNGFEMPSPSQSLVPLPPTSVVGQPTSYRRPRRPTVGLDQTIFNRVNAYDVEKQKPTDVQFNLRTEEWWAEKRYTASRICVLCGIAPGDVDPSLVNGVQKTATEINAETDLTKATIVAKRSLANSSLNMALTDMLNVGGYDGEYFIVWPKAGITNASMEAQRITGLYAAGLYSRFLAIRELHPDWTDLEVAEEIERIKEDMQSSINPIDLLNPDANKGGNEDEDNNDSDNDDDEK